MQYKYKEIQPQSYLNLFNGKIYYAIEAVLRIINNSTEGFYSNSFSDSRLDKLLSKQKIKWSYINRKETSLLTEPSTKEPEDLHAASLVKIPVLNNIDIKNLLKTINNSRSVQHKNKLTHYKEINWGVIIPQKDTFLSSYYSINRVVYGLNGHSSTGFGSSTAENFNPKTVLKKAKQFAKAFPDECQIIKVSPTDINFGTNYHHTNSIETYVNLALHDKLIVHYIHQKGVPIKKETENLETLIGSNEPVALYLHKNFKDQLKRDSDSFSVSLTSYDIRALDKSISRRHKKVRNHINKRFSYYDKEINHYIITIKKYDHMRESLRNFLKGDYYNKVICSHFKDPSFKNSLTLQIKNIINLY